MKLLSIDTSTQTASVAVIASGKVMGEMMLNTPLTHSQKLMPLIESLIGQLSLKIKDFDGFCVCEGPGSFTGVRIGLSSAKAFAQAHGGFVVTETSMGLLALGNIIHEGIILAALDAKRREVYYGIYRSNGKVITKIEEDVMPLSNLLEKVENMFSAERILCVGEALNIYSDEFSALKEHWNKNNYILGSENHNLIHASSFAHLPLTSDQFKTYQDVKANYMRKSQAERDRDKKREAL